VQNVNLDDEDLSEASDRD